MTDEKIKIKTENGQVVEVVVLNKNVNRIEVVIGEGVHNVRATLTPTRNEMAYAGSIMGREIVYERSKAQVQADIDRLDPRLKKSR
jgi:K+/H+ antiporter YhaU regulatory subunit KhtT